MTDIPGNQPPPQFGPPQPYPPPPYPPVIYPPAKKGPSALKIVLIVIGVFVGLALIGIGFLSYEFYRLAKSSHMTTSSQPVAASDLGVAIYPGAEQKINVRMAIIGKSVLAATFFHLRLKSAGDRVLPKQPWPERAGPDHLERDAAQAR